MTDPYADLGNYPTFVEGTFNGLHIDEIRLFQKVLPNVAGVGVEIGSMDGYSTTWILHYSNLHRLHAIDPIVPDSMAVELKGDAMKIRQNTAPYADRFVFHQLYSQEVIQDWHTELDFLFIDGDHRYKQCLEDFDNWTPLLKPGGLLAMHDSRMNRDGGANFHPGPSQVADEKIFAPLSEFEVVGEAFSLVLAQKNHLPEY
jgi:hypothetical protein